jgi:ribonucleoside-diphosphate reductase alpha chain
VAKIISDNALTLLKERYFIEGETVPEQIFKRVAYKCGQAEKEKDRDYWIQRFFQGMMNLDFMPNSPALMNLGTEIENYSACFVVPVPDSMEGIFEAVKQAALISKSGGGVGLSFSRLRPKNEKVGSTGGVASGPISFMYPFNAMVECVKQGSKRRGALMGLLRVDHPDIEDFIVVKDDLTQLTNFNLSVGITDEFMEAVNNDTDFDLKFNGKIYKTIKAKNLWNEIVEHAWLTGDPGLLFIDEANRCNNLKHVGDIETTNPCGEQPLLPYEACNLLSINLLNMIKNKEIDFEKLEYTVNTAVRFLDNIIEISKFPLPQIDDFVRKNRKIGLGIMGFADMLYELNIPYDSNKALSIAKKIQNFIYKTAEKYSIELGVERGIYPNSQNDNKRNAALTTIAPTGSISIICDVSSGCEPNFALSYKRFATSMNKDFYFINQTLKQELESKGLYSEELLEKINKNGGSVKGLSEIPNDMQKVFVIASEISPEWHVKMQATFQNNGVDSAVSKTINLPNNATIKDVNNAYMLAYNLKCKGITVYRDGCRQNQVLTTNISIPENNLTKNKQYIKVNPPLEEAYGKRRKFKTGCGSIWLKFYVNENGELQEIFTQSSGGGCKANIETISRLVSLLLRANVDPEQIMDQLSSSFCKTSQDNVKCKSCGDVIAKEMKKFIQQGINIIPVDKNNNSKTTEQLNISTIKLEKIQDCTHPKMVKQEGCEICPDCGYSKCS